MNEQTKVDPMATGLHSGEPKQNSVQAVVCGLQTEEKNSQRTIVSITRYAFQLLDLDNLWGSVKPLVDQLRYSGLIRDDSQEEINLEVAQVQVRRIKEVGTKIEITYPPKL